MPPLTLLVSPLPTVSQAVSLQHDSSLLPCGKQQVITCSRTYNCFISQLVVINMGAKLLRSRLILYLPASHSYKMYKSDMLLLLRKGNDGLPDATCLGRILQWQENNYESHCCCWPWYRSHWLQGLICIDTLQFS